jgi:hypothetical protein
VRSGYLNQPPAAEIYSKLEALEARFRRLLNEANPDPARVQELESTYRALQMADTSPLSEEPESGSPTRLIPQAQFTPLYQAIKQSEISFEELLYAPLLRITPDARFETMRELIELKRKLWSEVPA